MFMAITRKSKGNLNNKSHYGLSVNSQNLGASKYKVRVLRLYEPAQNIMNYINESL
jgi:hypothetical protein